MLLFFFFFFFFNDTATTEIYTLSLHDALPIFAGAGADLPGELHLQRGPQSVRQPRSEEHTSELQSHVNLVCRLLLEKKKKKKNTQNNTHKSPQIEKKQHITMKSLYNTPPTANI